MLIPGIPPDSSELLAEHRSVGIVRLLGRLDVRSLLSLWALRYVERNLLSFLERLEPAHVDCREMGEQVLTAVIGRDEAIAFGVVEPLYRPSCHAPFPCKRGG